MSASLENELRTCGASISYTFNRVTYLEHLQIPSVNQPISMLAHSLHHKHLRSALK